MLTAKTIGADGVESIFPVIRVKYTPATIHTAAQLHLQAADGAFDVVEGGRVYIMNAEGQTCGKYVLGPSTLDKAIRNAKVSVRIDQERKIEIALARSVRDIIARFKKLTLEPDLRGLINSLEYSLNEYAREAQARV